MADTLYELAVKLTTEGEAQMRAAFAGVTAEAHETEGAIEGVETALHAMMGPLLAIAALAEGGEIFHKMIEDAAELAVVLERSSQMTGVSAEHLAELGEAAELTYVEVDALPAAFRRLSMAMSDSHSRGAQAMKAMGLDVKDFKGDAEAAFNAIAEKFSEYQDGASKSALQTAIFGRGAQITPLLNSLKEAKEVVEALGQTMTAEQKKSMLDYEQAMIRMKITTDGFTRQIAAETVPVLTAMADAFTINLREGEKFNVLAEVIAGTVRFLATVVLGLREGFDVIAALIVAIINQVLNAAGTIGKVMKDIFVGDGEQMKRDIKEGLDNAKELYKAYDEDVIESAQRTHDTLARLYGFSNEPATSGPRHAPGTRTAPTIKEKPEEDKAAKKRFEEMMAMLKAVYELEAKTIEDSTELEDRKYARLKELDEARLLEVVSGYGVDSAEYANQLKEMEEHRHKHEEEILKWKKWGEEQAHQVELQYQGIREAEYRQQQQKVKELSTATANIIEQTFKAGFEKGGTIGGAMKAFGDTILQGIGGIMVRMGETYIEYSSIMLSLAALLPDPFTAGPAALAIGAALIGLGSALGAIGGGGGGSGGGNTGAYGGAPPASFPTQIVFGQASQTTAAGMTPVAPVNVTVIGPNDPTAQRQIVELVTKAQRRNG